MLNEQVEQVTSAQNADTEPTRAVSSAGSRLKPVVEYLAKHVELALDKAVAHRLDPKSYPMPSGGGMETAFKSLLDGMPAARAKAVVSRVAPDATNSRSARQAKYGPLAQLDLHAATALATQARQQGLASVRLAPEDVKALLAGLRTPELEATAVAAVAPVTGLTLLVHEVRCVRETTEIGKDEISIGGVQTNFATDKSVTVPPIDLGTFAQGDVKKFAAPLRFPTLNLREGATFPKVYFATVALAEVDGGGFSEFLDGLIDSIVKEATVLLGAILAGAVAGGAVGTAVPGIGNLIGIIVGGVLGLLGALLKSIIGDEIFPAQPVAPVQVSSLTFRFPNGSLESPRETLAFSGFGGQYRVTTSWRLA